MGEKQGEVADSGGQRQRISCSVITKNHPNFCRLIVSTTAQDMLRIPGKFVKKLGNEISNVATLITPNGCVCHVRLEKIDGKFCFTDGWHEFVKHQSIGVECLLIFTYLGNSILRVNIYDISNAEINYRCNNHRGVSCGYQVPVKAAAHVELLDRLPQHQAPRSREKEEADSVSEAKVNSAKGDKQHSFKNLNKAPVPCAQCVYRESSCGYREPIEEEVQDDEVVEILDTPPPCPTPKKKEVDSVFEKTAKANGAGITSARPSLSHEVKGNELLSELMASETRLNQGTKKRKLDELKDSTKKKVSESPTPGTEISLRRSRAVTPQEKVKVQNVSRMFRSENPFCRVSLRPSYVYKGSSLHFPSSFAERYLRGVSRFITIAISTGEEWLIRCTWLQTGSAKLTTGWHQFVLDNRLEEGDVCVFELIKTVAIVLKVTVYRVAPDAYEAVAGSKKINETMQNSEPTYRYDDGVEILDTPPHCPTPKSREKKEADGVFEKTAKAIGAGISNSQSSLSPEVKGNEQLSGLMTSETKLNQVTKKRKIDECEDSTRKKVSVSPTPGAETSLKRSKAVAPEEIVKVLNLGRMFRSENPFCWVSLQSLYLYKGSSLPFPSSFAERYLRGVLGFITIAISTGEEWPVRCTWLQIGLAVLTTGWHQFVLDNRLEEGDVCVFELIKMVDIVLKVTIYRVAADADQDVPGSKKINETMQISELTHGVTTRSKSAKLASVHELNG